jgi:peptidoglycan/LPS O-acetylase OafA/YrhL
MWFALVMLAAYLFLDPTAQRMADSAVGQAKDLIDAQLPVFFTALFVTLLASAISWFMANLPRRQPQSHFRVVKRYRVQE